MCQAFFIGNITYANANTTSQKTKKCIFIVFALRWSFLSSCYLFFKIPSVFL
ncbi:hypothetical protein O23A_p3255 [Aeromonas salmonicida]|nr:hypothetical protein O23A_p3255 [Aeromonas salmonicida]